jgi:hypothetical protein
MYTQTPRDVLDKYSPIVQGQTGILGAVLRAAARPVEWAINLAGAVGQYPLQQGYTNAAGQTISDCDAIVPFTLYRMEGRLQSKFAAAAARPGASMESVDFLIAAKEIEQDAATLSPLFNVKSGTNFIGGERYKLMAGHDIDIEAALAKVEASMAPQRVMVNKPKRVLQKLETLTV